MSGEKSGHPSVVFSVRSTRMRFTSTAQLRKYSSRYYRRRRSVRRNATACVRSIAERRAPSGICLNRVRQWRRLAASGSHFARSQAFFKDRCRFSLSIWTDSSLRIRIGNISGTSSGGGAALTNRLFSGTPDSGCVRHGFGSQFCKGLEGHAAKGAWHRVLPTIQDSSILIPRSAG